MRSKYHKEQKLHWNGSFPVNAMYHWPEQTVTVLQAKQGVYLCETGMNVIGHKRTFSRERWLLEKELSLARGGNQ